MTKKILSVFAGDISSVPPVWLMRQAGRYLPEYMATRAQAGDFLGLVYNPELATEVTMQPLRRYGLDAAILFSDILTIPQALGQKVAFEANHGPVLGDLPDKLAFDNTVLQPVYDAVSTIRAQMVVEGFNDTALIGFSGSPWTLACYMIEQRGSKDFQKTRVYALTQPDKFQALIDILVDAVTQYLLQQIAAGAELVQLFDSWAGVLSADDMHCFVMEPTARIVRAIKAKYPDVPVIGFPKGIGIHLPDYVGFTDVDGVSLDAQTPLSWAFASLPEKIVVQGNLDPLLLVAGGKILDDRVDDILRDAKGQRHIFNLGHGIDKSTPPENVARLITRVRGA